MPDFSGMFELVYWAASILNDLLVTPPVVVLERGLNAVWVAFIGAGAALVGSGMTAVITGISGRLARKVQEETAEQVRKVQEATAQQMQEAQLAVKMLDIKRTAFEEWQRSVGRLLWELMKRTDRLRDVFKPESSNTLREALDQVGSESGIADLYFNEVLTDMATFFVRCVAFTIVECGLLIDSEENGRTAFNIDQYEKIKKLYDHLADVFRRDLKIEQLGTQQLDTFERIFETGQKAAEKICRTSGSEE